MHPTVVPPDADTIAPPFWKAQRQSPPHFRPQMQTTPLWKACMHPTLLPHMQTPRPPFRSTHAPLADTPPFRGPDADTPEGGCSGAAAPAQAQQRALPAGVRPDAPGGRGYRAQGQVRARLPTGPPLPALQLHRPRGGHGRGAENKQLPRGQGLPLHHGRPVQGRRQPRHHQLLGLHLHQVPVRAWARLGLPDCQRLPAQYVLACKGCSLCRCAQPWCEPCCMGRSLLLGSRRG